MNKKLLVLLFIIVIAVADKHYPTGMIEDDDDKDEEYVPVWKINVVLRDNGSICYDYLDGCNYVCTEKCFDYSGSNTDAHLAAYKYCCPKHV